MKNGIRIVLAATLVALAPAGASAQAGFPSRQLTIVVPFPAGSGTDTSARFVAQKLSEAIGQPVVVDNKPGANGFIAAQAAARAAPDGHTLFVTTMTTQSVNPFLFKQLPYDPERDFAPVSMFVKSPLFLVVRNDDKAPKTLPELIERARAGNLTYASGNTSSRLAAELLAAQTKTKLLHVPYRGTPQALADLLGGRIDLMFPDVTPATPHVRDGKLRALGVTGRDRVKSFPDVPTMAEIGVPIDLIVWAGAFAPAGTPKPVVERLSAELRKIVVTQEALDFFARFGGTTWPTTPEEMAAILKKEREFWGAAVKAAGIEPE